MEVRQKTLDLTMDLVTSRTAEELIKLYRKELFNACSGDATTVSTDKAGATSDEATYRFALVHTVYDICTRFPATLSTIIPTICDVSDFSCVHRSLHGSFTLIRVTRGIQTHHKRTN